MKYSPKENLFYDESIHGDLPNDCIDISDKEFHRLLNERSQGKVIYPREDGYPATKDAEVFIVVPSEITRAQGKAVLIRAGLWQRVVDFVNSISDPVEKAVAEVALNDTTHWQRSSPFLNSAAEALGLTDEQLDQLFIDASKIEL